MFKEKIINLNSIKILGGHFVLCVGIPMLLLYQTYQGEQSLTISCFWEKEIFLYGLIQGLFSLRLLDLILRHYRDVSFSKKLVLLLAVAIWGVFHSYYGIIVLKPLLMPWECMYGIDDFLQKLTKGLVLLGIYCFTPLSIGLYSLNPHNKIFRKTTQEGH